MSKEIIDACSELIQRLGFPVVVSVWFMLRMEKRLDRMLRLMDQIVDRLSLQINKNGGQDD